MVAVGGFFINCYQSRNKFIQWHSPRHRRVFCSDTFGGLLYGFCCHLSLGVRWTLALGALPRRVPSGSCYIYGPRVLKFILRLSCYLADLLCLDPP